MKPVSTDMNPNDFNLIYPRSNLSGTSFDLLDDQREHYMNPIQYPNDSPLPATCYLLPASSEPEIYSPSILAMCTADSMEMQLYDVIPTSF